MRSRFEPVRFVGHLLFASLGSGLAMVLTFLIAWYGSGNAGSLSSGAALSTLVIGIIALTPLILPTTLALIVAALAIRSYVPRIEPDGMGMTLILGMLGIGINMLMATAIGIAGRGEGGRYLLLSVAIGGALCGIIIAWRMRR